MGSKVFERIGIMRPKSSPFDLSHERKLSMNMGELIPILNKEILPGDHFRGSTELMARMAPMLAPIQHRINAYVHYFFVPTRILWDQWEDFITAGKEGTTTPVIPKVTFGTGNELAVGDLGDYMGLPPVPDPATDDLVVSALPFRAYQQIYNDYYVDENLANMVDITDASQITVLRKRAWEKDYFTSCLPWTQRGPEVGIPVDFNYKDPATSSHVPGGGGADVWLDPLGNFSATSSGPLIDIQNLEEDGVTVDINQLRQSSALQRFLEKAARGGYRLKETILAQFGVQTSDARLQRAEWLGGGRQPMKISEVLNTSGTATEEQGYMAGHGISVGETNRFKKRFEEHGYLIGILSILPRTAYMKGVHRDWKRFDRTDYYWPEFANLGEQAVLNSEVYYDPSDANYNAGTFGYQQQYAEYKYAESSVHGEFRTSLAFWHMGRNFGSQQSLNAQFVQCTPTDRIFAVAGQEQLYVLVYNNLHAKRLMPFFANPTLR